MEIALITGSGGLVGVETVKYFSQYFDLIIGIDNDSRGYFFGPNGSVQLNIDLIKKDIANYVHYQVDIRDRKSLQEIFNKYKDDIKLIINTAAQPSHDWSGKFPQEDFEINAVGALNVLEQLRFQCPKAVFIQISSSKVYGDSLNNKEYQELDTRYDFPENHDCYDGFDENLGIDQALHSPYGVSKLSSDLMCQEYARYYGLKVGVFRPNCITGGPHSGVELHGFLSYLVKCKSTYNVFGFKGKQVRDNIHARDLVSAIHEFYKKPNPAQVYNIGGGRKNSCSILEAIKLIRNITGKTTNYKILDKPRVGDHIWWITNNNKFKDHYPDWKITYDLEDIIKEIYSNARIDTQEVSS